MILFNGTAHSGIILYLHFSKINFIFNSVTFCIVVFSACGIVSNNQSFMLVLLFSSIIVLERLERHLYISLRDLRSIYFD